MAKCVQGKPKTWSTLLTSWSIYSSWTTVGNEGMGFSNVCSIPKPCSRASQIHNTEWGRVPAMIPHQKGVISRCRSATARRRTWRPQRCHRPPRGSGVWTRRQPPRGRRGPRGAWRDRRARRELGMVVRSRSWVRRWRRGSGSATRRRAAAASPAARVALRKRTGDDLGWEGRFSGSI